jgi:hypothetical protein
MWLWRDYTGGYSALWGMSEEGREITFLHTSSNIEHANQRNNIYVKR